VADRIIPGVSITVVREVVPRPLGATGVLGIVGPAENDASAERLGAIGSVQEFRDKFGPGSMASMPEVAQAFANGLNQVVVANLPAGKAGKKARLSLPANGGALQLFVEARAPGAWANGLHVTVMTKPGSSEDKAIDIEVRQGAQIIERFSSLSAKAGNPRCFYEVLHRESGFVRVVSGPGTLPVVVAGTMVVPDNDPMAKLPQGFAVVPDSYVAAGPMAGGTDALLADYVDSLTRLENFEDVDMVTVSHSYSETSLDTVKQIWAAVRAHCDKMSRIARSRIGFGQVPAPASAKGAPDLGKAQDLSQVLTSERFVLSAPYGYLGAVIGTISALPYYFSPTFKTLPAVADLSFDFTDPQLEAMIKNGVCAVDMVPRHGVAIVKGITTDAGQINVTRVADRAVRVVQNIAQDFIGLLNTQDQRLALQQRIIEAFTAMEREQAIVPSTDGKSPAFQVAVGSTQADFAAGIVRVDIAVRPVRAIDYIYATINVKAF
jgi:hypothetical protein